MFSENLPNLFKIRTFAHEGQGNDVNFVWNTPYENVFLILLCQCRKVHFNSWKINILPLAEDRRVLAAATNQSQILIARKHCEGDRTIGTQNDTVWLQILSKLFVAHRYRVLIPLYAVICSYSNFCILFKMDRLAIFQKSSPYLRTLSIIHLNCENSIAIDV